MAFVKKPMESDPIDHPQNQPSLASLILSGLVRLLGGLAGIALLLALYKMTESKDIFKVSGFYGLIAFPGMLFGGITFVLYAIGGQKFLRKFVPSMAEKQAEAAKHSNEMHKENNEPKK